MFLSHSFMVSLTIAAVFSYHLQCPDQSQRSLRSSGYCTSSRKLEYTCLYDTNRLLFYEQCNKKPDYVAPGEKYAITGSLRNIDCSSNRYQPFPLWSNVSGVCLYQKSVCEGPGLVFFNNGSLIEDNKCRCDYTKGFEFIQRPKQNCFCIPSEEDCSCYIRNCNDGFMLSSDYECVREDERHVSKCPSIESESGSKQSPNIERVENRSKSKQLSRSFIAMSVVLILISVFICIIVLGYTGNKLVFLKNKRRETRLNEAKVLKQILVPTLDDEFKEICHFNLSKLKKTLQKTVKSGDKRMLMMMLKLGGTDQFMIVMNILVKTFKIENYSSHIENDQNTVLMIACMTGDWNVVKLFLKNVNIQNERGETPLMIACKHSKFELIRGLIRAGANVNLCDEKRRSPLHFSCSAMHVSYSFENIKIHNDKVDYEIKQKRLNCLDNCSGVICFLIQHKANVKLDDNQGVTPLMLACQAKCVKSVEILLQNAANINAVDKIGNSTALLWAFQEEYDDNTAKIVKLLIDNGADVNCVNNQGDTPFIMACKVDQIDMIKQLTTAGIDVMSKNSHSLLFQACSLLHFKSCCSEKCTTIINFIIERYDEKYVNDGDLRGVTPLMLASYHNCSEAVAVFLKHGANPNAVDQIDNSTALFWAIRRKSDEDVSKVVEILLNNSSNVDLFNNIGITPIMLACGRGEKNIARMLNGSVQNRDEQNKPVRYAFEKSFSFLFEGDEMKNTEDISASITAFTELSVEDMITVVSDLIMYKRKETRRKIYEEDQLLKYTFGDDVTGISSDKEITPLLKGFEIGNLNILRLLIKANVDTNKSNIDNVTPLMKACELDESYIEIVNILVSKTLDINIRDKIGRTALFVTCMKTNPCYKIVKSLFEGQPHKVPDCTVADNFGITPLMSLCCHRKDENVDNIIVIINFLIEHLPDVKDIDQKGPAGKTCLSYACKYGHYKIVKTILDKGASISEDCINIVKKRDNEAIQRLVASVK